VDLDLNPEIVPMASMVLFFVSPFCSSCCAYTHQRSDFCEFLIVSILQVMGMWTSYIFYSIEHFGEKEDERYR
jgi:DMSO reductase anchor subunit